MDKNLLQNSMSLDEDGRKFNFFHSQIQSYFEEPLPPLAVIEEITKLYPGKKPYEIIALICITRNYVVKREFKKKLKIWKRELGRLGRQKLSDLPYHNLLTAIANLLPNDDRGSIVVAERLIWDLERRRRDVKNLSNRQLLEAIKRAHRRDSLDIDRIMIEIRKIYYTYTGDPDKIQMISVPIGGRTDKYKR